MFSTVPACPAENRWTAWHPLHAWMTLVVGLFDIGSRAFMLEFDGAPTSLDAETEEGVDRTQQERIKIGKRMRRSKESIFTDGNRFTATSMVTLNSCAPYDQFVHLMLRDVGCVRHFDWRARVRAMGQEW
jgi:hypothetical protein